MASDGEETRNWSSRFDAFALWTRTQRSPLSRVLIAEFSSSLFSLGVLHSNAVLHPRRERSLEVDSVFRDASFSFCLPTEVGEVVSLYEEGIPLSFLISSFFSIDFIYQGFPSSRLFSFPRLFASFLLDPSFLLSCDPHSAHVRTGTCFALL